MALFDVSLPGDEFDENSHDDDFLLALQLQNRFDQNDKSDDQSKPIDQVNKIELMSILFDMSFVVGQSRSIR
jgi:hypothetical protein